VYDIPTLQVQVLPRLPFMKIVAITKIVKKERKELNHLKKKKVKTNQEKDRELFLGMKQFWNCEC
jgi:hypothetical protein